MPTKIDAYTVRHLLLRLISQQEFEKGLPLKEAGAIKYKT
jgi:hypothetical protein